MAPVDHKARLEARRALAKKEEPKEFKPYKGYGEYIEGVHPSPKEEAEWDEHIKNMPKRTLKKRACHIRKYHLDKLIDIMDKVNISLLAMPLTEDSWGSGEGEDQGFFAWVYYDPKAEAKVLRGVQAGAGFDLSAKEAEPLDPDTDAYEEQRIMYHQGNLFVSCLTEYEVLQPGKGPIPPREDGNKIGWGGNYVYKLRPW